MNLVAADRFDRARLAACFTAAFDGYIAGSFVMDAQTLVPFLDRQGADLALSRCVERDGALVGLCFVGEFERCSAEGGTLRCRRVGGMGVVAAARGSGASRQLLQQVIDDARAAGCDQLELEVFAQNDPAVRLYRAFGFEEVAPLWGFEREAGDLPALPSGTPKRMARRCAAQWVAVRGPRDLPYQLSAHTVAKAPDGSTLWRLGKALAIFSEPQPGRLALSLLVDMRRNQADARALLAALIHAHPAHAIRVPQLMRDDCAAEALRDLGFRQLALHQLQMRLRLR